MSELTDYLLRIGISDARIGFYYITTALDILQVDPLFCFGRTCKLYEEVARRSNTTACAVNNGIKAAISAAWERGDMDFQEKIFGYSYSASRGKPSNREFLCRTYNYLNEVRA